MPEDSEEKVGSRDTESKNKLNLNFRGRKEKKQAPREKYTHVPISYYWLKDLVRQFISHEHFPDAFAVAFAIISASTAFPYFPIPLLAIIVGATFVLTLYSPFLGFMLLMFETLAMFIYQAPLLAWLLAFFIGISFIIGHEHYRTITFVYAIMMLSLSSLGNYLVLPAFIIGSLYIGFKRSIISVLVIILMVSMISGLAHLQNSALIVYNYQNFNISGTGNPQSFFMASKPVTTIGNFLPSSSAAVGTFYSHNVTINVLNLFALAFYAMTHDIIVTVLQISVWMLVVFAMTNYVIKSRSAFKGTEASLFSFVIVLLYLSLSYFEGQTASSAVLISLVATPITVLFLEYNNITVVRALDVMKQDFLGSFGEAFQELTSGTKETLDDVANYDETKLELRQAILGPIEHREISGAYKVKAAKGVLLFGPPGNGKTLIMRALANEVRARFFYVKTSSLVSPFQGESLKTLSKIFDTVRKHQPAILFFDEIDGIASKREMQESENNRQLLSLLLAEMDGFQRIEGVVVVGTTNAPQLLDESILRPGRFDKIIYMALPTKEGREKIFEYYLKKLPIREDINYSKLADLTKRYSGADIKSICDEVAREVADEAVKNSKVLEITSGDVAGAIKQTKPSTSLATLDKYNTFKIDYERRAHKETTEETGDKIRLNDVVDLSEAKKALFEAIEIPIVHPELVKKYDVQNIKGVLLFGPPGVGKTMLMKALANELQGVNLIVISGADIGRAGLENAIKMITDTFNRAKENQPSVIFIDEIDAIAPSRENASELTTQITSELLQNLDGLKALGNIVIVAATNRPEHLDPAILRAGRFDRLVYIEPPNKEDRKQLFRINLKKAPHTELDYDRLADLTAGYTGADIANICRQAKLSALESNISTSRERKITMDDIIDIIKSMEPSAPSRSMSSYINFISLYKGR